MIKPLHDLVLIELSDQDDTTDSGIVLGTNTKDPVKGKVLATGPKAKSIRVGDTVMLLDSNDLINPDPTNKKIILDWYNNILGVFKE